MSNESTESDQKTPAQEAHEQLEWDRLQHEALAAQRWRLEQEIEQAQQPAEGDAESESAAELFPWSKLVAPALALLAVLTGIVLIAVIGW